jgi:hypothetical protein
MVNDILNAKQLEQVRAAGYVIVPLRPSEEMLKVGAPKCFQPAEAQSEQTWKNAMSDAQACYQAMIECGAL